MTERERLIDLLRKQRSLRNPPDYIADAILAAGFRQLSEVCCESDCPEAKRVFKTEKDIEELEQQLAEKTQECEWFAYLLSFYESMCMHIGEDVNLCCTYDRRHDGGHSWEPLQQLAAKSQKLVSLVEKVHDKYSPCPGHDESVGMMCNYHDDAESIVLSTLDYYSEQLQQKEAENAELKQEMESFSCKCVANREMFEQLQSENARLEAEVKELKEQIRIYESDPNLPKPSAWGEQKPRTEE